MGWRHLLACLSCKMLNVKYEISGQLLICSNTGGRLHLMHHWKWQPFSSHFSASFLQKTPFVCTYLTPYWLPISTFLCLVLSWPFQSPVLKLYFISLSWIAMLCMIWGSEKKKKEKKGVYLWCMTNRWFRSNLERFTGFQSSSEICCWQVWPETVKCVENGSTSS